RSFVTATLFEMTIDQTSILVEKFYRNPALRRRRWNGETRFHVLDDLQRWSTDRNYFGSSLRRGGLGLLRLCRLSLGVLGADAVGAWLRLRGNFGLSFCHSRSVAVDAY